MNLLLVTFSLRNPAKDYSPFFVALRGNAVQWWHFIEQTCVLTTHHDVGSFARQLYPHMEASDSLLVVTIQPYEFEGWLPGPAWDWLLAVSAQVRQPSLPNLLPPPPAL
jgi:hypothetical protein